jgi:hypothetical protein
MLSNATIESAVRRIGLSGRAFQLVTDPIEALQSPFAEPIERIKRELAVNPDLPYVQLQVRPEDLFAD